MAVLFVLAYATAENALPRISIPRLETQQADAGGFECLLSVKLENQGALTGTVSVALIQSLAQGGLTTQNFGLVEVPLNPTTYYFKVAAPHPSSQCPEVRLEIADKVASRFTARGASLLTAGVRPMSGTELLSYGADAKELGEPIGGGAGYSRAVLTGDVEVASGQELFDVLRAWQDKPADEVGGKVVRIRDDAEIELAEVVDVVAVKPYTACFEVPAGVTLAGNRGAGRAAGPLLKFTLPAGKPRAALAQKTLFRLGAGARLTGLRIRGPDFGAADQESVDLKNSGFRGVALGEGAEVDNCCISHFNWADVVVDVPGARVHCNELSDAAYPVMVGGSNGYALITGNRIYWAWHAIAGSGQQGTGYEAAHNEFIHVGPGGPAHAVDMHAWRRMMRGFGAEYPYLSIAGDVMKVHHNTFLEDAERIRQYRAMRGLDETADPAVDVCVRGVPRGGAEIYRNRLLNACPEMSCRLVDNISAPPGALDRANFWVYDNVYGPEHYLIPLALEGRPRIKFLRPSVEIPRIDREWRTAMANVITIDEAMPVVVEVEAMPPLQLKQVRITAGNLEMGEKELFAGTAPPQAGEIVLRGAEWGEGVFVLTVHAEDERGVSARHSTAFTVKTQKETP